MSKTKRQTKDDVIDEFDETIPIDLMKDICSFCRKGHIEGLKMNKILDMEQEIDDEDEDGDVTIPSGKDNGKLTKRVSKLHPYSHLTAPPVWVSPYSLTSSAQASSNMDGRAKPKRRFFHYYCAQLGPLSWFNGTHWHNLRSEVSRSQGLTCSICKTRGASLGCFESRCHVVVHIPCAIERGYLPRQVVIRNPFFCDEHRQIKVEEDNKQINASLKDLSRGREPLPILCESIDDLQNILNDFEYFTENVDSDDVIASPQNANEWPCCDCDGVCDNIQLCACLQASQKNYSTSGMLSSKGLLKPIIECNKKCNCSFRLDEKKCQLQVDSTLIL